MRTIFLFFVLFFNTIYGQNQNDLNFCKENLRTCFETVKIPKFVKKYLRKNSNTDKYLLYHQNDEFVQTSKLRLFHSNDRFLIKYLRNTSLFSNELIIVLSIQDKKVLDYFVMGNKCMNKEDINEALDCNCKSELNIFSRSGPNSEQ